MSRLIVLTTPARAPGYRLAGVETHAVPDVAEAEALISGWLDEGEQALVAVEEALLAALSHELLRRLRRSEVLLHVAIPGQRVGGSARIERLRELMRRGVGPRLEAGG